MSGMQGGGIGGCGMRGDDYGGQQMTPPVLKTSMQLSGK